MAQEKPRRGYAAGRGLGKLVTGTSDFTRNPAPKQPPSAPAPTVDLVGLRERLVGARRRLVERLGEDFPPDRRFPDSGWTRMLADIEIAIMAVAEVMDEDGGAP